MDDGWLERHESPDGLLVLRVDEFEINGLLIYFEGYDWHVHPELLQPAELSDRERSRKYVDDILAGYSPILIKRVFGVITDVDVFEPEDIERTRHWNHDNPQDGTTFEIRYWNGDLAK